MSNIDWRQLVTKAMKDQAATEQNFQVDAGREVQWRTSEMTLIAEQLVSLEDDDPSAAPGTEREWRDYRILVRAWKAGADGYPDSSKRPARPS